MARYTNVMNVRLVVSAAAAVMCMCTLPVVASAQTSVTPPLGPGCRPSTAADLKAMADRGIPQKYEVCPADLQILGIGKTFEQWYAEIKATSPCNKNTCTLSCRTNNTGAQVCGPTATRWNSIGCHPVNKTAIFPSVPYGFAAHIELLRRYCGERGRCTILSAIQQWAPASDGNNPSSYAAFVSKAAGIPQNQVYDPNDVELMARLAMAMSCMEAGALPYSLSDLRQGMQMAAGGARVPVPSNVGQILQQSLTGSYAPQPAGAPVMTSGSWAYVPSNISSGMYAPPIPPPSSLPVLNTPATSSSGQPMSTPTTLPPATQTNTTQTSGNTPNANVAFPPASLIIAQPRLVSRGDLVSVSWTSVGMSSATPCQLLAGDLSKIAGGSEGTYYFPTVSTTQSTVTFTEKCITREGSVVHKSASVTIQ